jgi:hypothetical protein
MTLGNRRVRVPALFLVALAALLALAATASAETRGGESSTVVAEATPTPVATLVKATATYESSGNAVFQITTAAPENPASEGEIWGTLATVPNCGSTSQETFFNELFFESTPPILVVEDKFALPEVEAVAGALFAGKPVPGTKAVSGSTVTLTATSSEIAEGEFNCALIAASDKREFHVEEGDVGVGSTFMSVPLVARPDSPPPSSGSGTGSSSSGPGSGSGPQGSSAPAAPAPPALSIGKLKPVTMKAGKWQTVKVTVTNTGAGGSAAGSLRVKGSKGAIARPERQQLPALAPGRSFTLTFRVQLTAKAKKRSSVALTATASGLNATGSLVVKLKE